MIYKFISPVLLCFLVSFSASSQRIIAENYYLDKKEIVYASEFCDDTSLPNNSADTTYSCTPDGLKKVTVKGNFFSAPFNTVTGKLVLNNDSIFVYGHTFGNDKILRFKEGRFQAYDFSDTLGRVNSIAYDEEKNQYLGTSKGLYDGKKHFIHNDVNSKLLYNSSENIKVFDNKVWYVSNDVGYGYLDLAKDTFVNFGWKSEHYHNSPIFLEDHKNNSMYILTNYSRPNLSVYNKKSIKSVNADFVNYADSDKEGNLWISSDMKPKPGTNSAFFNPDLYKVVNDTVMPWREYYNDTLNFKSIKAFHFYSDSLFVGTSGKTNENGLHLFNGSKWSTFKKENSWLPSNNILDLKLKGDTLVILSDTAVSFFNLKKQNQVTSLYKKYIVRNIEAFPNPCSDKVTINISDVLQVEIKDLTGNTVQVDHSSEINVSLLPSGVYILKITLHGGEIVTNRIFKK